MTEQKSMSSLWNFKNHWYPHFTTRFHERSSESPAETMPALPSWTAPCPEEKDVTFLSCWSSPFPLSHGTTLLRPHKCPQKPTHRAGAALVLDQRQPARGCQTLFSRWTRKVLAQRQQCQLEKDSTETMPTGGGQLGTHAQESCTLWAGNRPWTVTSPRNVTLTRAARGTGCGISTSTDRSRC